MAGITVARTLLPSIQHMHSKDVYLGRGAREINKFLEIKPFDDAAGGVWNYMPSRAIETCSLKRWKGFVSMMRMMNYNDQASLEIKDLTMVVDARLVLSVKVLPQVIGEQTL
ncbi:hypothetical protein [Serratia marcescens]|uniref:hypothetical protein n=1 Tax=Serratia marcescens TaxID=615 RepID=UPI0013D96A90|nr:hypothetical protein [Serratia marcescens]